jgi:hypothetical protein
MLVNRVHGMRWRTLGGLFALLTFLLMMLSSLAFSSEALAQTEGSSGGGSQQPRPVDRLIKQQVGEFRLQEIKSSRTDSGELAPYDFRRMVYENSDGEKISHHLTSFSSPEAANEAGKLTVEDYRKHAWRLSETFTVVDKSGRPVGSGGTYVQGDEMAVIWTNGNLLASMEAPAEEVGDFFKGLPYGVAITDRVQY